MLHVRKRDELTPTTVQRVLTADMLCVSISAKLGLDRLEGNFT